MCEARIYEREATVAPGLDMSTPSFVIEVGDIVQQRTDVIVNAANSSLMGGGGVDGAIHGHGGPSILSECIEKRRTEYPDGLPAGYAVATTGGNLRCRWVIHTVGPVYHADDQFGVLTMCYQRSLLLADGLGVQSIAFPLIGAGAYGWPAATACRAAIQGAISGLRKVEEIADVHFVLYREELAEIFRAELERAKL